jgi:D-glycero-alpha-D-manno-heptose-7-phosphate kinase
MIISRTPFRITLAGGGTDLPSFYSKHGSRFLSCAIDKYIYVGFKKRLFDQEVRVQYLDTEVANHTSEIKHNRARACLEKYGFTTGIEVTSVADLSAKSGMGSSGSYIVGLLACLRSHLGLKMDPDDIAEEACDIEMNMLGEPVGKQDQYIASHGSITEFSIDTSGKVTAEKLQLPVETIETIEKNCLVFYTGVLRSASDILRHQQDSISQDDSLMIEIQKIGIESIEEIKKGNLDKFGKLMHLHWLQKRKFSKNMSLGTFDSLYESFISKGDALGGKIIGAGGGGFMMLYVPKDHDKVEKEMKSLGFPRMTWKTSQAGVSLSRW